MKYKLKTKGIVLILDDLTIPNWPQIAADAGLNTIALHAYPTSELQRLIDFVNSDTGALFKKQCNDLGISLEYECHVMEHLLPRNLFDKYPELFRVDESGNRNGDCNLCVSSNDALEIVVENAVSLSNKLKTESGRYFFWGDDGKSWCNCSKCRQLSNSDQALLVVNNMASAIRKKQPKALIAHSVYYYTIQTPKDILPVDGVFMEFAPIKRRHDIPFNQQNVCEDNLDLLDANLEYFGVDNAQILEYWVDVSRYSGWKKPAKQLRVNQEVLKSDLDEYTKRGIRNIMSFSCFIDAEYLNAFGELPINNYGTIINL